MSLEPKSVCTSSGTGDRVASVEVSGAFGIRNLESGISNRQQQVCKPVSKSECKEIHRLRTASPFVLKKKFVSEILRPVRNIIS